MKKLSIKTIALLLAAHALAFSAPLHAAQDNGTEEQKQREWVKKVPHSHATSKEIIDPELLKKLKEFSDKRCALLHDVTTMEGLFPLPLADKDEDEEDEDPNNQAAKPQQKRRPHLSATYHYIPLQGTLAYGKEGAYHLEKWVEEELAWVGKKFKVAEHKTIEVAYQRKVLCILGDTGSGKSTFTQHLERKLWKKWQGRPQDIIPFYIPLNRLKHYKDKAIEEALYRYGFDKPQRQLLQQTTRILFILDGYDELPDYHNLYETNQLHRWEKAQTLITSRVNHFTPKSGPHEDLLYPISPTTKRGDSQQGSTIYIAHFSATQRDKLIQLLIDHDHHQSDKKRKQWKLAQYQACFDNDDKLQELVQTPLLTRMVVQVLPRLVEEPTQRLEDQEEEKEEKKEAQDNTPIHRSPTKIGINDIYHTFLEDWLDREIDKKEKKKKKKKKKGKKNQIKEKERNAYKDKALAFAMALALKMTANNRSIITYPLQEENQEAAPECDDENALFEEDSDDDQNALFEESDEEVHKTRNPQEAPLDGDDENALFEEDSDDDQNALFEEDDDEVHKTRNPQEAPLDGDDENALFEEDNDDDDQNALFEEDDDEVHNTRTPQPEETTPPWDYFFNNKETRDLLHATPLRATPADGKTTAYTFLHKSLQDYYSNLAARAHLDGNSKGDQDLLKILNTQVGHDNFQVDTTQEEPTYKQALYRFIEQSKQPHTPIRYAATNALAILNEAGEQFHTRNFDLVKAPYTSLHHAVLDHSTWRGADLSHANFAQANMIEMDCTGANIQGLNFAELAYLPHPSPVSSVTLTPDGKYIVSGSRDKTVRIWDRATAKEIACLKGHTNWVTSVTLTPDGKYIVSGSLDNTVRIWDRATAKEIACLMGHTHWINSVTLTPDGKYIVSGSLDKTMRIWDRATAKEIACLMGHTHWVESVTLTPDGKYIVSGSWDKTVRIWDRTTTKEIACLKGHIAIVNSVTVTPDGKYIVSGSNDSTVRIWDRATAKEIACLKGHTAKVSSVTLTPDGKYIVSGSWDNTVRIWDRATAKGIACLKGHTSPVRSVTLTPDGKYIVSGALDKTVRIWDRTTPKEIACLMGHTDELLSVTLTPDGKYTVSGAVDKTVRIWDRATAKEIACLMGHTDWVKSVTLTPDGKYIVSGSKDKTVRIWDRATAKEIACLNGHTYSVRSVTLTPDGKYIVSASLDKTVRIWDRATAKEIACLMGHTWGVLSVTLTPDGNYIVSGSLDETVRIWDRATAKEIACLRGHTADVSSVTLTPDGKYIVSGSDDKTVRIWDRATAKEIACLRGHTADVSSVTLTPDGKYIVSGSDDKTVRIWDRATTKEIACLMGHTRSVSSVTLTPDGKYIVSGSHDNTVRIWEVSITPQGAKVKSIRILGRQDTNGLQLQSACFKGAKGMNIEQKRLLIQRGAILGKEIESKEDSEHAPVIIEEFDSMQSTKHKTFCECLCHIL